MQSNLFKQDEFITQLSTQGLSAGESYAKMDEKIIFNSQQFADIVTSAYNCDY